MKALLLQLDGKLPNLALMRIAAHHRACGDEVSFRRAHRIKDAVPDLWEKPDRVYASLIFERTRPVAEAVLRSWPDAIIGGTGWDLTTTLEQHGIGNDLDYSLYPTFTQSIGFTQRGCRLKCPFCVVPKKEGAIQEEKTIQGIWRGSPHPRHLVLLDNDFFGQPHWRERIREIREGGFKVNFNQGINARFLTDETAEAIASIDYRNVKMDRKNIYTAWDNRKDEDRLFRGLWSLAKAGIRPKHIIVYILLGYWKWSGVEDWNYRRQRLREFGADPYPMPYERTKESVGFQRWVIGAYDKRVSWEDWVAADYRPEKLTLA